MFEHTFVWKLVARFGRSHICEMAIWFHMQTGYSYRLLVRKESQRPNYNRKRRTKKKNKQNSGHRTAHTHTHTLATFFIPFFGCFNAWNIIFRLFPYGICSYHVRTYDRYAKNNKIPSNMRSRASNERDK